MKELGVEIVVVINVVGGVNILFELGDFMLILDYINFMGMNLLIGLNDFEMGVCFFDMFILYIVEFCEMVK